jgi:hypothetical protein
LQSWDEEKTEAPLKIAVKDANGNTPFSLAFLWGHTEVAKAVLDIAKAQYAPEDKEKSRYKMDTGSDDDINSMPDSEEESDEDDEPRIKATVVDKKFTIENIGQVSMQVKSRTRPIELLQWKVPTFKIANGKVKDEDSADRNFWNLWRFVLESDNQTGLKTLLDFATELSTQKLDGDEEEASGWFSFPEDEFRWAVENGKTPALAEIIKRTGAGIPLDHLVKKSGVELQHKPRYYQGLTVYGKKR